MPTTRLSRRRKWNEDNPYYSVAVVFTLFMCDNCREMLLPDNPLAEPDWYQQFPPAPKNSAGS